MIHGNQMPPGLPELSGMPPGVEPDGSPTSIPVQAVDADQLPREKGLTYEEVSSIVGSLYLDSHHQLKVREEQFSAIVDEYDKTILQTQAQVKTIQQELETSQKEVSQLRRELEKRDGRRPSTPSSNDGDN